MEGEKRRKNRAREKRKRDSGGCEGEEHSAAVRSLHTLPCPAAVSTLLTNQAAVLRGNSGWVEECRQRSRAARALMVLGERRVQTSPCFAVHNCVRRSALHSGLMSHSKEGEERRGDWRSAADFPPSPPRRHPPRRQQEDDMPPAPHLQRTNTSAHDGGSHR